MDKPTNISEQILVTELKQLIESSRKCALAAVNAEISYLYWNIGKRINEHVLGHQRAAYGKQIVTTLAQQITDTFGKGWGEQQLRHCLRSAETFTAEQIHSAAQRQLSWTHLKTIKYLKTELPSKALLKEKLHQSIILARQKLESNGKEDV
jgi:hypothetical protein